MDLKDLQNLIRFVSKSDVAEVKYKTKEYEISIRTNTYSFISNNPSSLSSCNQSSVFLNQSTSNSSERRIEKRSGINNHESRYLTIKSPMIGTFYQKSGPEKPFFVKEGDIITPGKILCIVEAMKLFNEIESEISGTIVKILVEDSTPVEYDQPLFLVDPS